MAEDESKMRGVRAHRVLTVVDEAAGWVDADEPPEWLLRTTEFVLHPERMWSIVPNFPPPDPRLPPGTPAEWVEQALARRYVEQARAALTPKPLPRTAWSLYDYGRVAINPDTGEVSIRVPLT